MSSINESNSTTTLAIITDVNSDNRHIKKGSIRKFLKISLKMVQKKIVNFLSKVPGCKIFYLCWSKGPCHNYSFQPLQHESSHRQYVNK